jgi:carbon-monoxide dehydrogenase medium subunit
VYPSAFDYEAPADVRSALVLLAQNEDAKVLAGGQSLIPMMKLRFARPSLLVDIGRIQELRDIELTDTELRLGAMVRECDLTGGSGPLAGFSALQDTARVIADPLVRNSASIGGNLAHGDPENDQPATMLALDATFVVDGLEGSRLVASDEFFRGLYETALEASELLTQIRIPRPEPGSGSAYVKLRRQVGDFAIFAAAAALTIEAGGITRCRIAMTGVGTTPVRAESTEQWLIGREASSSTFAAAARHCADTTLVPASAQGGPGYVARVIPDVVVQVLAKAAERATGVAA